VQADEIEPLGRRGGLKRALSVERHLAGDDRRRIR
jgi:hypothetical protein